MAVNRVITPGIIGAAVNRKVQRPRTKKGVALPGKIRKSELKNA